MQIDFHHGAAYMITRFAGFGHREAERRPTFYFKAWVGDEKDERVRPPGQKAE